MPRYRFTLPLALLSVLLPTLPLWAQAPATQPAVASAPAPAPARFQVQTPANPSHVEIGSNDKKSGYKMRVWLKSVSAGVYWTALTDYQREALNSEPYAPLRALEVENPVTKQTVATMYHMGALRVWLDDSEVILAGKVWSLQPGATEGQAVYHAIITDPSGRPVLRIERTWSLAQDSYDLRCRQRFVNLAGRNLKIVWQQMAQGDIALDEHSYMGDRREFFAGYYDLSYDPGRINVYTKGAQLGRASVLDHVVKNPAYTLFPNTDVPQPNELIWLGTVNRYFALVVHAPADAAVAPAAAPTSQPAHAVNPKPAPQLFAPDRFASMGLAVIGDHPSGGQDHRLLGLTLTSQPLTLPAGGTRDLDVSLFVGPRNSALFAQAPYSQFGLNNLVIYNLGGFCSFCTFQWLAHGLLWLLEIIFFVVRDWGLAIIVLVLLVRAILHPITRSSQISMTRMQKQMASLQPELQKLKKKYANDPKQFQAEQMRLFREHNVNPAGMLGCLPMFLQMPIWFALYAMLFYAIELRQQPGIYGLFQSLTGDHWAFLADLSRPDNFIPLPLKAQFAVPLLGIPVEGIHILPLLMAVVFYLQVKYTSPPPANEQAAQQQKMMKWVTMIFPVFLYAAPSGLNLYILASTAAGIVDSAIVKRHIKREEEAGTLFQRKPGRFASLMQSIQQQVESKRTQMGDHDRLNRRK